MENLNGFARAHTNIALIKYWGKANDDLIIPSTDSVSLTLDKFYTDTSVTLSDRLTNNTLYINDHLVPEKSMTRVNRVVEKIKNDFNYDGFAEIKSTNHVPTSAGLASSASGIAALTGALFDAFDQRDNLIEMSRVARLGSGSASRSIFGGLVHWTAGDNHETSYAQQIAEPTDLNLDMITLVVNKNAKKVKSTFGMNHTAHTSPFYKQWVKTNQAMVPKMLKAISEHNFSEIGELSERSATLMHSTTLSSVPSFTYFQPETIRAMQAVQDLRKKGLECYFTIDAGPNVKILCQKENSLQIQKELQNQFSNHKLIISKPGSGIKFDKD